MKFRRVFSAFACSLFLSGLAYSGPITYTLGPDTPVLDPAFYLGEASDASNVSGRSLLNFGINHAGTEAAFFAINLNTFAIAPFTVQLGDPSSWKRESGDIPFQFATIRYTPDDRTFMAAGFIFKPSTGELLPYTHNGTCIAPVPNDGLVGRPMFVTMMGLRVASSFPLRRMGRPEEVAKTVAFLASEAADFRSHL